MKRLINLFPILFVATLVAFLMMRVGRGPHYIARHVLGVYATEEMIEAFLVEHGLHRPLHQQYTDWIIGLFRGDLGTSLRFGNPVGELIMNRIPITFQLMGLALSISIILGITGGVIGALYHNTWVDYVTEIQALFWISAPSFWVGVMFSLIFGLRLGLLPTSGYNGFEYLILPAVVLGLRLQAIIARLTRSSMLSVLNKEYIKTAKTKGLKRRIVIIKHGLRNALIPVLTIIAMRIPWLFGGAMVTEQVFNIPGMGRLIYTGAMNFDFILVQSSILLISMIAVFANLTADILYTFVDPRIDLEETPET